MGIFNPRRSTAIGLGGISPVAGAAVGGLFGGGKPDPRYSTMPAGRTIVKGGMDTQAPVAAGTPDVTLKDKAALAAIRAGQSFNAGMQPAAPAGRQGLGGMFGAAMRRGRIAGYADGGKVINRKPNGKRC